MSEETELRAIVKDLAVKIEGLASEFHASKAQGSALLPTPQQNFRVATDEGTSVVLPRSMRLEVPRFNGSNPEAWIFAIEEYFNLYRTSEEQRLQIISFNMDGETAEWFRWMKRNNMVSTWEKFLDSVKLRFGLSQFEDPLGALCKLLQRGSVAEYQATFEKLMNCVTGVFETHLISYYVSGLKPSLQRELLISKPASLGEAFSLARVYEARTEDSWGGIRSNRGYGRTYTPNPIPNTAAINTKPLQALPPIPAQSLLLPAPTTKPPLLPTPSFPSNSGSNVQFRRTTAAERKERLAKELCFTYD